MAVVNFLERNILAIPFYAGLIVFSATLCLQFLRPAVLRRHASRIFIYSTLLAFIYIVIVSFFQFRAFQSGILGSVLGTGTGFRWFLGYVRLHFWNDYLVSLPFALAFAGIARYFNKKYNERFFENEEIFLIALGILLVGYPGFFFYIILVLALPVLISAIFLKNGERLPLYHFWVPTAIAVLLAIHFWAQNQSWWATFRF